MVPNGELQSLVDLLGNYGCDWHHVVDLADPEVDVVKVLDHAKDGMVDVERFELKCGTTLYREIVTRPEVPITPCPHPWMTTLAGNVDVIEDPENPDLRSILCAVMADGSVHTMREFFVSASDPGVVGPMGPAIQRVRNLRKQVPA